MAKLSKSVDRLARDLAEGDTKIRKEPPSFMGSRKMSQINKFRVFFCLSGRDSPQTLNDRKRERTCIKFSLKETLEESNRAFKKRKKKINETIQEKSYFMAAKCEIGPQIQSPAFDILVIINNNGTVQERF